MTSTEVDEKGRSGQLQCGCCGRTMPAHRLTELRATPGVYICSRCARWAARQASHWPDLRRVGRRVVHDAVALLRGGGGGTFRSAIPILPSADLERTIAFWRPLGFEVVARYDGYLVTHADGVELHFTVDAPAEDLPAAAGRRPGEAFVHVRNALALWKRLRSADVAGTGPVEDRDYGLREFVVTDLDGNRVRFGSPVPAQGVVR
jgi:catechol 2,3-dioxygenase-like lactoylglutathione lyase family enzyme